VDGPRTPVERSDPADARSDVPTPGDALNRILDARDRFVATRSPGFGAAVAKLVAATPGAESDRAFAGFPPDLKATLVGLGAVPLADLVALLARVCPRCHRLSLAHAATRPGDRVRLKCGSCGFASDNNARLPVVNRTNNRPVA
jgi:ribosomal protein S27AE